MSSFFEDHKDIKLAVHESVGKLQQENKLIGWVRADEVLNPKQYLDQITALQKEKEQLNKENSKLKNQSSGNSNLEADFDQIIDIFSKEEVSLKSIKTDENQYPDKISILKAIEVFKDRLVIGTDNSMNATNQDLFIFFELAPKLQIHGLMQIEKITNTSTARRVIATEKGKSFLAHLVKRKY